MKEIILILDNIRSVLNVGAIFRTADGAGVKKIFICGISPLPNHKKLKKTALGAEDNVQWEYFKHTEEAIKKAKEEGFEIHSVELTEKAEQYYKVNYSDKVALVFGHEITGVSPAALEQSNKHIILPMLGKKNSLNVATCVGILVYHIQFSGT